MMNAQGYSGAANVEAMVESINYDESLPLWSVRSGTRATESLTTESV